MKKILVSLFTLIVLSSSTGYCKTKVNTNHEYSKTQTLSNVSKTNDNKGGDKVLNWEDVNQTKTTSTLSQQSVQKLDQKQSTQKGQKNKKNDKKQKGDKKQTQKKNSFFCKMKENKK